MTDANHRVAGLGPALVLRFDVESAGALVKPHERTEDRWPGWIDECLGALRVLRTVLDDVDAPASFFLVGELLERAGDRFAELLGARPGFDIGNHTYSHWGIQSGDGTCDASTFRRELRKTSDLIARFFSGSVPVGFTAPGCYYRGLRGKPDHLRVLWSEGYRYITSDGQPGPDAPRRGPAPMTQPYAYDAEGFGELLEQPLTGWHCNMLFNTGGQNSAWRAGVGYPDGRILEVLPRTVDEGYAVRSAELDYAVQRGLVYAPCMHPWSIYRFDPELRHVRSLIEHAQERGVAVLNCRDVYRLWTAGG